MVRSRRTRRKIGNLRTSTMAFSSWLSSCTLSEIWHLQKMKETKRMLRYYNRTYFIMICVESVRLHSYYMKRVHITSNSYMIQLSSLILWLICLKNTQRAKCWPSKLKKDKKSRKIRERIEEMMTKMMVTTIRIKTMKMTHLETLSMTTIVWMRKVMMRILRSLLKGNLTLSLKSLSSLIIMSSLNTLP